MFLVYLGVYQLFLVFSVCGFKRFFISFYQPRTLNSIFPVYVGKIPGIFGRNEFHSDINKSAIQI